MQPLRIETGNVELAALAAPTPMAMTAADDWTIDMMTDGFPQLRQIYRLFGTEMLQRVRCDDLTHFPHNYNYVTRGRMYHWMNRHLNLKLDEPIVEDDWQPLSDSQAAVWNAQHPAPSESGLTHLQSITAWLDQQANIVLASDDGPKIAAQGWESIIGRRPPAVTDLTLATLGVGTKNLEIVADEEPIAMEISRQVLHINGRGEAIPMVQLRSPAHQSSDPSATGKLNQTVAPRQTVLWFSKRGKRGLLTAEGLLRADVAKRLRAGDTVIAPDVFGVGESNPSGSLVNEQGQQRLVNNGREFAGYTFGYNHSVQARRIHDAMSLFAMLQMRAISDTGANIMIMALEDTDSYVLPAQWITLRSAANDAMRAWSWDYQPSQFRYASVDNIRDASFLPGAVKYGDLEMLRRLLKSQ
ncbi:MAG: hypothetical protein AAFP69_14930 [Planctomycetota bacterium]